MSLKTTQYSLSHLLQDQYVNFLATVGPFLGPVLDLASYVSPGMNYLPFVIPKQNSVLNQEKQIQQICSLTASSFSGTGWMTQRQRRCVCSFLQIVIPFIQVKRVYIPIGNFFFLSDEKSRSKSFSTIEFNRVVEALDILKDVEVSTSVQSHKLDNYMKIARRNDLFFPGSYPAETTYMDGDYVLTVPRRLELIGRLKMFCCFCDIFLKV